MTAEMISAALAEIRRLQFVRIPPGCRAIGKADIESAGLDIHEVRAWSSMYRATCECNWQGCGVTIAPPFAGSPAATAVLADENEMQVLVHPDDWKMLAFESPSGVAATETPDLFGVPVLYDEE